jgi:hypothetical protein
MFTPMNTLDPYASKANNNFLPIEGEYECCNVQLMVLREHIRCISTDENRAKRGFILHKSSKI